VQRYLAARSVDEARTSLLMSAYWKIPLQALILLTGVLVYLFYVFTPSPLLYNPRHEALLRERAPAEYAALAARHEAALTQRAGAALALGRAEAPADRRAWQEAVAGDQQVVDAVRAEALAAAGRVSGEPARDVNYIMPRVVLDHLPLGLAGLFLAAVLAAAMSSIAAELNALATATVVDFYQRWVRPDAADSHLLAVSKGATAAWGVVACVVATFAATLGSLIEVVNRFGSFFYGSILGVFLLAMLPGARARGAFAGLLAGMATVAAVSFGAPQVSFLWHNVIGAVVVVLVGMADARVLPRQ
jgi:Na+/proline symporter